MKHKKEFRTGVISLLILVAFVWILNFIKGYNIFSSSDTYYAMYPSTGGLQTGRPVKINGVRVGIVSDISFSKDDLSGVVVKFDIESQYRFSTNSIAQIAQGEGLMSDVEMNIVLVEGDKMAQSGDTLSGQLGGGGMIAAVFDALGPIKDQLSSTLVSLDSVLCDVHHVLNDSTRKHLNNTIADLSATMTHLRDVSAHTEDIMSKNKKNLNAIVENTARSTEKLNTILDTVVLRRTIENIDATMADMRKIAEKINKGSGSAAMLINDRQLYQNLSDASNSLNALLADIKEDPKRYINVTVFGKKERTERQLVKDSVAAQRIREKAEKKR